MDGNVINVNLCPPSVIRPGTKAAEGVPEADMIKRARVSECSQEDENVWSSIHSLIL